MAFRTFVSAMDRIRVAVQRNPDIAQLDRILSRLTADAQYYAGRDPHAEAFEHEADVWQSYLFLAHVASITDRP